MADELELEISEVIPRTYNVKSIRLGLAHEARFKAGQFLCVWLENSNDFKRYLSISNSPTEKGYLEFTKKITQSAFSQKFNTLKVGDRVKIQYPFGKFTLEDNSSSAIAFISGGIGITPIRSICKYAVDKRLDTDIVLLYANRTIKDIVFREDFELMQEEYPKLKVSHVLSAPAAGFPGTGGRIDSQIIKNKVANYTERKFFLCGPPAMVEAMKKILSEELSIKKENIVTENFQGY